MTLHDALLLYAGGAIGKALNLMAKFDRSKLVTLAPKNSSRSTRVLMTLGVLFGFAVSVVISGALWLPKTLRYWAAALRDPTAPSSREELITAAARFWFAQRTLAGQIVHRGQFSSPAHAQEESNAACEEILAIVDDLMLDDRFASAFLGIKEKDEP